LNHPVKTTPKLRVMGVNAMRRFSLPLIFVGLFWVMISVMEAMAIESDLALGKKWS
jgi:hypothetical protein